MATEVSTCTGWPVVYADRQLAMLDPKLLKQARRRAERLLELERQCERSRADYHHAIRQLHLRGGTMREIAAALGLSHQRVGQIVKAGAASWLDRIRNLGGQEKRLRCSFCDKPDAEVEKLVAGPGVFCCDGCLVEARAAANGDELTSSARLKRISGGRMRCSFCGKPAKGSRLLVGTSRARICTECLPVAEQFAEEA